MKFPITRARRLRKNKLIRDMVAETHLSVKNLIYPIFVEFGKGGEIKSMPGVLRYNVKDVGKVAKEVESLGIPAVILFGIPDRKDEMASGAYDEKGVVQEAIGEIKGKTGLVVIADVCLCEYTSHGHCGIVKDGKILNDPTLELLSKTAVSLAKAGADIVAPSDMMDGRVGAIRKALDQEGFEDVLIMAYSAKYASAFYGPFREAAESAPAFGDRSTYQMDMRNAREAIKEVEMDIEEGADIVMVKPALSYLDIIYRVKELTNIPVAAYNVSGEYALIKAGEKLGWVDGKRVMMEVLYSIKRAGADLILTYFAKEVAPILKE
jgi:porphobilinogen synthase